MWQTNNHKQKSVASSERDYMLRQMALSGLQGFLSRYMKHSEMEVLIPYTDGQREHILPWHPMKLL